MQLASPVKKLIPRTDNAQELCWFLRKNPTKQAYSRAKQIFTAISKASLYSTNINREIQSARVLQKKKNIVKRRMDEFETHQYGIRCINQGAVNWIIRVGRTSTNRMT